MQRNGIFYVTKNGCIWRDLPGEFPPWQTVYWYYRKWVRDGTWDNINRSLVSDNCIINDKSFQPTTVIIDSQSIKNSSTCTEQVGIDGGKLIKGRKRFIHINSKFFQKNGTKLLLIQKQAVFFVRKQGVNHRFYR